MNESGKTNEKELNAARMLFDMLVAYYDDSQVQPPILAGDDRHRTIADYREAMLHSHLPPGEGELMRRLLDLSRAEELGDRKESQSKAERWAKLLLEKYQALCEDDGNQELAEELGANVLHPSKKPRPPENLTQAQRDIWDVVVEHGRRMGRKEIGTVLLQKGLRQNVSTLKANLATLSRRLRVLPHRTDTKRPGYGLPEWE